MTVKCRSLIGTLLGLILGIPVATADACSLADGYLKPSNYDLVKQTDAILLVEAVPVDSPVAGNGEVGGSRIVFKVLETLKGKPTFPDGPMSIGQKYWGSSPENDFSKARPGAFTGACNAYDYEASKKFLLFLVKYEGKWVVSGPPFSRINEEVSGPTAPWVEAVQQYVRIAALSNYDEEKLELRNLQKSLRDERRPYSEAVVRDIDDYFGRPYSSKSYQDLMSLYKGGDKRTQRDVLWAFARGKHKEAEPFIQDLMKSSDFISFIGPVTAYAEATQDRGSVSVLAGIYPGIKEKQTRWPIMLALIRLAGDQDSGLMLAAFKTADVEEAGRFAMWFARHPDEEATNILRNLAGSQFRDHWEISMSLAALADKNVVEWAKRTIAAPKTPTIQNMDLTRALAVQIVATSPLAQAEALTKELIAAGDVEDLGSLSEAFLTSDNPTQWERLREIPNLKVVNEARGNWIRATLERMTKEGNFDLKQLLTLFQ